MPLFEIFADPRWRQERLFLAITLPLIAVVLAVIVVANYYKERLFVESTREQERREAYREQPRPTPPPRKEPQQTQVFSAEPSVSSLQNGITALRKGDLTSAKFFLTKALKDNDDKAEVYNQLGLLAMLNEENELAIQEFSNAIALNDQRPLVYMGRSEALRKLKRQKEALSDLKLARKLDPPNPLYSNKILLTRLEAGDRESVRREIQATIDVGVSALEVEWLGGAAGVEIGAGNSAAAVNFLKRLQSLVPPLTYQLILADHYFERYANDEELQKLLIQK